jgi:hypothetical protein
MKVFQHPLPIVVVHLQWFQLQDPYWPLSVCTSRLPRFCQSTRPARKLPACTLAYNSI